MKKLLLILLVPLSVPMLLFVYQPAWALGTWAYAIGTIGRTLSPLILFGSLAYLIGREAGVRRLVLAVLGLLSLPVLLHVYQPTLRLGGPGLILGGIGMTLSPLILYGALLYVIGKEWSR